MIVEEAIHFGKRRNRSECFAPKRLARNLANREHPFENFPRSRRSPRTGTAPGALAHKTVASKPAARERPDMSSGQAVVDDEKMEAKRHVEWIQATEASDTIQSAWTKQMGTRCACCGNLQMPYLHSNPPLQLMSQRPEDHPRVSVQLVRPSMVADDPDQGLGVEDPQRCQAYLASPSPLYLWIFASGAGLLCFFS